MKRLKILIFILIVLLLAPLFSGCTSGQVSLFFTAFPKLAYKQNEQIDLSGMKVEAFNTDGTTTVVHIKDEEIEKPSTETPGEKIVKITHGEISTTFSIYVANYVVNQTQNIKPVIESANDGEIVLIKQGEYKPQSISDESLYNILINKKITIIGEGNNNTILHGNLILGANNVNGNFIPKENFSGVNILNIGFKLDSQVKNRYRTFEGPYGNYDLFGAIKTNNSSNITIKGCSFSGYSYGVNADNITGLTLINNRFRNIFINALKVSTNIKYSTIAKNEVMDIGTSSLVLDNNKQGNVGALYLSFTDKENAGVIIANNSFVRIGLIQGDLIYNTLGADELETTNEQLTKMSYINNSAIIFLVSASENNLQVGGIILSMNNFGTTLENISFGTNKNNLINQTGVIINDA